MLSNEEQSLLDGMEKTLHEQDPSFTQRFDLDSAQHRHQRRAETRMILLVLLGAFVLSAGVATIMFDPITGSLIAGLGCALLVAVVRATRRNPLRPRDTTIL